MNHRSTAATGLTMTCERDRQALRLAYRHILAIGVDESSVVDLR
jgi:hypothetical protein